MIRMVRKAQVDSSDVARVREWIERDVTGDRSPSRFHARVAANVLAMVERELELGSAQSRAHGFSHDDRC